MKTLTSILLFIFCTATVSAQVIGVNTTRFIGDNSTCYIQPTNAITTTDGGILFVGTTSCYSGGGDIPPSIADASGSLQGNVVICKVDSNMNVSWVRVYGGTQYEAARGAVQTPDGGYAVLAYTYSDDYDVSGNHGTGDIWLLKTDGNGNLLWQKCYGSAYDEQAIAIALAPDNGFIFYGASNGMGGDVPVHYSGSEFDYDWFVVKTDDTGAIQWTKTIGGTGDENFSGSILVGDGGYYLVNNSASNDHDCTDTAWHPGVHGTDYDYYIFKLDMAGNILWDSSYGGAGTDQTCTAIWDSKDSSIVITGFTSSDDYMVTGYHALWDMWVMKADRNGKLKWETCLGSAKDDFGTGVVPTSFGYIACGYTYNGIIGPADIWLFSIDTAGNTITNKQFGGTGGEKTNSIIPFKQGYAVVGITGSPSFTEGNNIGNSEGAFVSYVGSWPLGVQTINITNEQLIVYPNPANAMLKIVLPNKAEGTLTITNCIGLQLYTTTTKQEEDKIEINTAEWAKGMYIVKWRGADGTVLATKLIVN